MTSTFRPSDISPDALTEKLLAPPSATALTGDIITRSQVFFTTENDGLISGTWECEPGKSRWEFLERGEIIHVLSGRMTVHEDFSEAVEVDAGTTAYFPVGWKGTWHVHETLRKVFVVYAA